MSRPIPGSRVEELEQKVGDAHAAAAEAEADLERERLDAVELAPRQAQASSAYVRACEDYEALRDTTSAPLTEAAAAIDALRAGRRRVVEARRAAERIGADLPVAAPVKLKQTNEGRHALEAIRVSAMISV